MAPPSVSLLTVVFVEAQGSSTEQLLHQDVDPAVSPAGVAGPWIVLQLSHLLLGLGGCWNNLTHFSSTVCPMSNLLCVRCSAVKLRLSADVRRCRGTDEGSVQVR